MKFAFLGQCVLSGWRSLNDIVHYFVYQAELHDCFLFITVAILAQGTSCAVAVTQAFLAHESSGIFLQSFWDIAQESTSLLAGCLLGACWVFAGCLLGACWVLAGCMLVETLHGNQRLLPCSGGDAICLVTQILTHV